MYKRQENNSVFKILKNLKNNKHVIVDVENYSQLKKFSLVITKLIKHKKFLFRTAASFISLISEKKSFSQSEIYFSNLRIRNKEKSFLPGLIIVGSYVELSTIQLNKLLEISNCNPVELNVFEFFKITSSDNNQKRRNLFKNKFFNCIVESSTYDPIITRPGRKLSFLSFILKLEKHISP